MDKKQIEQQTQEKYLELQYMQEELQNLRSQFQVYDQQSQEIVIIVKALEDLKTSKVGSEVFVPIASGIYSKAKLTDNNTLLVNIGSKVVVEKTPDETIKLLLEQQKKLIEIKQKMNASIQAITHQAMHVQEDLNTLLKQRA